MEDWKVLSIWPTRDEVMASDTQLVEGNIQTGDGGGTREAL